MDVIKNNSKVIVKDSKDKSNKEQIEESQKKSVSKISVTEKVLNKDENESYVTTTFRDYSGRIKYDNINPTLESKSDEENIAKGDNPNLIKSEANNIGIIKNDTYNSNIVKQESSNDGIIKSDNTENTFKHSSITHNTPKYKDTSYSKYSKRKTLNTLRENNIYKPNTVISTNSNEILNKGSYKTGENAPFQYTDKNSQIKMVNDIGKQIAFDISSLKVDVVSHSQREFLSESIKDYLSNTELPKNLSRSQYSKLMHKRIIDNLKSKNNTYGFKYSDEVKNTDGYKNTIKESEPLINTSGYNNVINDFDYAFKYSEDNKNNEDIINAAPSVKIQNSVYDIIKPETQNKYRSKVKNNIKNTVTNKNKKYGIAQFGKKAAVSTVKEYLNSNDSDTNESQIASTAISTFENTAYILNDKNSRLTRGERRKKVFNKASTEAKANLYGIKPLNDNKYKSSVLDVGNNIKKIANVAGTSFVSNIKNNISENAENDMTIKAIDNVILTADKIKSTNDATHIIINSGSRIIRSTVNVPQVLHNGSMKLKSFNRKMQKFKQLSKKQRRAVVAKSVKKSAKKTAQIIVSVAKGISLKILGILFAVLILLIVIVCAVVAAVGSVIWQTSSDMDTTQIIKYISELDYAEQSKWASKGMYAIDIDKRNSNSTKNYNYYYIVAEDVPPETYNDGDVPDESNMHCVVRTGYSYSGNEIEPTYHGFNKLFNSADEMLETYRWTTDDYRAALAYLQVKNDNLGWLSNLLGFVGEIQLKNSARELHKLTYESPIIEKNVDLHENTADYYCQNPIFSLTYSNEQKTNYYYFGRKYTVKYLIDNDMIKFDEDANKNAEMKEQFYNVYKYGNIVIANLQFPLDIGDNEKISDKIIKHFGKQVVLTYTPPERNDDDNEVYGHLSKTSGYHYANDLLASSDENVYAPISGLCKSVLKSDRGYEITISTAYNGNDINYTEDGYLVKLSCIDSINISENQIVKRGDLIGKVGYTSLYSVNYKEPSNENEIFADKLFPCSTGTAYRELGSNCYNEPTPEYNHLHIEMYKLPCDFSDVADIEKNVLAPELFFDYSKEVD